MILQIHIKIFLNANYLTGKIILTKNQLEFNFELLLK